MSEQPTHFLSIHLVPTAQQKRIEHFFTALQNQYPGIPRNCYISPLRLHFTLQMLRLDNPQKVQMMKQLLVKEIQELVYKIFTPSKNEGVKFEGLDTFRGASVKLSETRVVFLKPLVNETVKNIYRLSQSVQALLFERGILSKKEASEKLVLHATVMNAKYGRIASFNAETVLSRLGCRGGGAVNHEMNKLLFGSDNVNGWSIQLTTLELSKLSQDKSDKLVNGFYPAEARIQFPAPKQHQITPRTAPTTPTAPKPATTSAPKAKPTAPKPTSAPKVKTPTATASAPKSANTKSAAPTKGKPTGVAPTTSKPPSRR